MIDATLEKLGLRDEEVKTFLYLLENGEQTAGNLAKKTGLSRPSLYGFLKKLEAKGLIIESQKNGVKTFSASREDKVKALLDERIRELEKGKSEIEKAFLEMQKGEISINPKFQLFEGSNGLRNILRDVLLYRDIQTMSYWPIKSIIDTVSADFFRKLNIERIKQRIYVRAIWPQNQMIDIKKQTFMGGGKLFYRETRIAPPQISFSMGYWIYGNKVAFISSKKEAFGFIVESKEFVEMLTSQFELVWGASTYLSNQDKDGEEFIKENFKL
jgi:sugar-specific transcriptional regulator TrmB